MGSVFDKLNLKQQREILVRNAPATFEAELRKLAGVPAHSRTEWIPSRKRSGSEG